MRRTTSSRVRASRTCAALLALLVTGAVAPGLAGAQVPGGAMSGRVVFGEGSPLGDRLPIGGAPVELCPVENPRVEACRSTRSDADGAYTFDRVPPGLHRRRVVAEGRA